jgi:hypothetical protein
MGILLGPIDDFKPRNSPTSLLQYLPTKSLKKKKKKKLASSVTTRVDELAHHN